MFIHCDDGFACGVHGQSHCWRLPCGRLVVCWLDAERGWRISGPYGVLKGSFEYVCSAVAAYNAADEDDFYVPGADTPWTSSKLKKGLPGSYRKFAGQMLAVRQTKTGSWYATLNAGERVPGFHQSEDNARDAAEQAAMKKARA
jgi:hypothetical protein